MVESNRVRWNGDDVKCFLEACIAEISRRGKKGGSLYPESWTAVQNALKETRNLEVSQKQMKNEYDYLKRKYTGWSYLTKMKDGKLYNATTNNFNLTNEEWEDFSKDHPKAAKTLRTSPLLFPGLCVSLFEGALATGDNQWTPSSNYPRPRDSSASSASPVNQLVAIEDLVVSSKEGGNQNPSTLGSESGTCNPRNDMKRPKGPNSNFDGARPKKRGKMSMKMSQLEKDLSSALKLIIKNHEGPSYEECVEKLEEVGLQKSCPLYVTALGIFCESSSYREGWMSLPIDNVGLIKSWISMVGGKLGFQT